MKTRQKYDPTFLIIPYFLLLVIGVVEVWSSSRYFAYIHFDNANFFLIRDILYIATSLLSAFIMSIIDYRLIKKATPYLILLSLIFMLLLHLGAGVTVRGATRWLKVGIQFEPSQFAELSILIYIAYFISKKEQYKNTIKGILPIATVVGIFFLLIALEPDVGTAFLIFLTFLITIYVAGYSTKNIVLLLLPSVIVLALVVYTHPEKLQRVIDFFGDKKINFQVQQALTAIGSGNLFGHGIGAGKYKNLFIPDSYNDFIMAGIGEDLGFFGIMFVVLLLISIIFSIFSISSKSNNVFGRILAFGIGTLLSIQAIINLFSVFHLMPPKGITMPFLSYGGTSLIIQGMMIGIVISICRGSCGKET